MKIDHESLTGTFEQKKALVQQFNLMHDDFFAIVMQDKKAFQVALRILTQRDDLIVTEVRTQYNIRNLIGHSVTLDAFAEDANGNLYNVEVQVCNNDYHQKRVRYYQSSIDMAMLEKGVPYSKLPDLYLLFISSFDIFKKNKACYEIKRTLNGFDEEVPNGIHELYFNTSSKENNNISELLHYFENSTPETNKFGELSERVKFYKQTQEGVNNMCDAVREYCDERIAIVSEKVRAEGIAEGIAKGREEGIAKGKMKERKAIIEKLRKKGMSEDEIKLLLDD